MKARQKVLAVLLAVVVSNTACTHITGPSTFDLGGSRGSCGKGESTTWGDIIARPQVDDPVRISHVELVGAKHIELVDTALLPNPSFGNLGSYPPRARELRQLDLYRTWQERKDVDDVVIPPNSSKWNIILGLKAPDDVKHASFSDVLVHFVDPDDGDEVAIGRANLEIHLVRDLRMCDSILD